VFAKFKDAVAFFLPRFAGQNFPPLFFLPQSGNIFFLFS
jgi:hypothetical protein